MEREILNTSIVDTLHCRINERCSGSIRIEIHNVYFVFLFSVVIHKRTVSDNMSTCSELTKRIWTHQASPSFTRTFPGLTIGGAEGTELGSSVGPSPFNSMFLLMVAVAASDRSFAITYLVFGLSARGQHKNQLN